MKSLWQDLRVGFRMLQSNPAFTVVAVVTLALAIGVNVTVFTWVDYFLLRPIPGATNPQELAMVEEVAADGRHMSCTHPDFRDFQRSSRLLAGVAAAHLTPFTIGETDGAQRVFGQAVSANYFTVLGITPAAGRLFQPGEDRDDRGAFPYAVISQRLWQSRYNRDPRVVGRTERINGRQLTIVGVAPASFRGTLGGVVLDVWVPLSMIVEVGGLNTWAASDRNARFLDVIVRRKPGVTIEQASAEVGPISAEITRLYPKTHAGVTATVVPLWKAQAGAQSILLNPLRILMGACTLLFLIACANVANLLLARAIARQKEFGVRMAMGAGRGRIIRQLLTEVLMISGAGALAGLLLAQWAGGLLGHLMPATDLPIAGLVPEDGAVNGRVLGFTLLACLATALLSSIVPVLYSTRVPVNETLKEGGRSGTLGVHSHRSRDLLVGIEVALAAVALIGAGLFARSFQNARTLDPGFDQNNVLAARFYLSAAGYSLKDEKLFDRKLRERLEASPGVEQVSYAEWVPLWFGSPPSETVHVEDHAPSSRQVLKVHRMIVAPGYFRLMRIPILAGRDFTEQDDGKGRPVLIVTEAFAQRYFPGRDPIGRKVRLGGLRGGTWFTVVGMARDSTLISPGEAPVPYFYVAFEQMFFRGNNNFVYIRTTGDAAFTQKVWRREMAALGLGAGLYDVMPLSEYTQGSLYPLRVAAMLLTVLGALSMALTAGGLYSVMAYAVTERRREIGVRMALGARPRQVLGLVLRKGMLITLAGLAAGVGIAAAGARLVGNQLVKMSPLDLLTFAEASLFLCAVALVATYLPARRATKVDPMATLRCE